MALMLQKSGFVRVRPLMGGLDAWRERNYPTELRAMIATLPSDAPGGKTLATNKTD
jgi:3-mercaptopyruvate sulfurtransferase SseA